MTLRAGQGSGKRRRGPRSRDEDLVRVAARRFGLQTAALVWLSFAVCAAILSTVLLRAQHSSTAAVLSAAVEQADDVNDPPDGVWLAVESTTGGISVSPGAPAFLPYRPASASAKPVTVDVHTWQGEFRVRTERRKGRLVQAAASLATEHAENANLVEALAVAGVLAVLIAGVLGLVAGRRWVRPLAEALARQRAFVADASHELRTPLTQLVTRAQLMQRDLDRGRTDCAGAESRALVADGRRLSSVLEDLLEAAEPDDATPWALVDLAQVAEAALSAVRMTHAFDAGEAAIDLEFAVQEDSLDRFLIRAPRAALDRAVSALLDNAIRHTPPGGSVRVRVHADRRSALLSVTDTGSGIPAQQRSLLFDRFAHGDRRVGDQPDDVKELASVLELGTESGALPRRRFGLGLALVADTVQRLGGDIDVVTGARGTTMTVRLPLAKDSREQLA